MPSELVGQEWRLFHAIALNAVVIVCAWRLARRRTDGDALAAAPWAAVLWMLVQYVSVSVPALAGVLNRWTMSAVAVAMAGLMGLVARQPQSLSLKPVAGKQGRERLAPAGEREKPAGFDYYVAWGVALFFAAYLILVLGSQWYAPPLGDDGLTYHLPAPVRWLRAGRFVLHNTWFLNPAATYNPLLGSTLAAWWMAPIGNDLLARFVQTPALVLVFFSLLQLCRLLGARVAVASIVALTAVVSRPFISQIVVVKDDLYLTGFFLAAILALSEESLRGRLAPWRLGIAMGMFLATKITALMAMPMLLLAADAPFRAGWRWRQWGAAGVVVLVLAGPWYGHNFWLTGNPLYPADISIGGVHVLPGLFKMARSLELRTAGGMWHVLTGAYFSMAPWMLLALLVAWGGAAIFNFRTILDRPLWRVVLVGPIVGLIVYAAMCQFPEVRYAYPVFALLFAASAAIIARWRSVPSGVLLMVFAGAAAASGFPEFSTAHFAAACVPVSLAGIAIVWARRCWPRFVGRLLAGGSVAGGMGIMAAAYIHQNAVVFDYTYKSEAVWESQYGGLAEGWTFMRRNAASGKTIAYTNTCLVYPLYGFDWDHEVVYAPVRRGVRALTDLPRPVEPVPGERMIELVVAPLMEDADRHAWIDNLRRSGAAYLFVAKRTRGVSAVELGFAEQEPARFRRIFDNAAAAVYEIRW